MHQCNKMNDKWAERVMARIRSVRDLPVADAVYHQILLVTFALEKVFHLLLCQIQMTSLLKSMEDKMTYSWKRHFSKI